MGSMIAAVNARTKQPGDHSRNRRIKHTLRKTSQCLADASPDEWHGLSCSREIHVRIFDGTNNDMTDDRPLTKTGAGRWRMPYGFTLRERMR